MKLLAILPLVIALTGVACSKKERRQTVSLPPVNIQHVLTELRRGEIQLLAMKHGLSPEKAELATWEYVQKHDLAYRALSVKDEAERKYFENNVLKIQAQLNEGVSMTVRQLSVKYGFDASSFSAFLLEFRAPKNGHN